VRVNTRIGTLVVVGVGLIGGSCALSLRRANVVDRIVGIGRGRKNIDAARDRGIVDAAYTLDDDWTGELATADVVLVAAPVAQYRALFAAIVPAIGPNTVVTDAGSTKQDVVAAAQVAFGESLSRFIPAHPIAGSEQSGALAADHALFVGRSVIVTPLAETSPQALDRVSSLWQSCGARVTTMSAAEHDRILAAVSHLPHVLAFVLVSDIATRTNGGELLARAGTGFRDFTRIAASSAEMWRDIALANRDALLAEIDRYGDALGNARQLIEASDAVGLANLFERAAAARRRLAESPEIDGTAP
jgi:prephenate dehydrogenase